MAKFRCAKSLQKFVSIHASIHNHSKLESTVRYLGIEVDDALEMSEATDV